MAIKQKTVTINGSEYLITSMPATAGTKYLKQLAKLLGPAFAELQGEAGVAGAISKVLENLDNTDIEGLVKALAATADKGGQAVNFDVEFSGEFDKLFKLLQEVVELNYGSVFQMLGIDAR